jgi:hypothetical protein
MKRKTMEDRILLAQSGELSPRKRARLERYLEQDSDRRAYREALDGLTRLVRQCRTEEDVSDHALRRIHAAAERGLEARRRPAAHPSWRPALACAAAALALFAAGLLALHRLRGPSGPERVEHRQAPEAAAVTAWDAGLDKEIEALDEMLTLALGNAGDGAPAAESLDELARELLELEGMEI